MIDRTRDLFREIFCLRSFAYWLRPKGDVCTQKVESKIFFRTDRASKVNKKFIMSPPTARWTFCQEIRSTVPLLGNLLCNASGFWAVYQSWLDIMTKKQTKTITLWRENILCGILRTFFKHFSLLFVLYWLYLLQVDACKATLTMLSLQTGPSMNPRRESSIGEPEVILDVFV